LTGAALSRRTDRKNARALQCARTLFDARCET
jgi:hypothetical protein